MAGPDASLRELSRPSLACWVGRALLNWAELIGLIALAGAIDHPLGYFGVAVLLGPRQHALSLLAHDAVHGTISRRRWLNDLLGQVLAFWPLFGPLDSYRDFHLLHHRTLGTDRDPELAFKQWNPDDFRTPLSRWRLLGWFLRDVLGFSWRKVFQLGKLSPPRTRRDFWGPIAWWLTAELVLWRCGWLWAGRLWWFAYFSSYWAFFRLRAWTEHMGTLGTHRIHAGWLARWLYLPHNTWYHWEHHLHPSVPCWNLPAIRAQTLGEGPDVITTPELWAQLERVPGYPYGMPPPVRA